MLSKINQTTQYYVITPTILSSTLSTVPVNIDTYMFAFILLILNETVLQQWCCSNRFASCQMPSSDDKKKTDDNVETKLK